MSNSSLVSYTKLSPNHSGQRTHSIDRITPHCVVGQLSAESICGCFISTDRQASCNYGIGTDGRIALCVEEKNRSWCSSSSANDQRAVTIECAFGFYVFLSYGARILWKHILKKFGLIRKAEKSSMLVVAEPKRAEGILTRLNSDDLGDYSISGLIFTEPDPRDSVCGIPVVSTIDSAADYIVRRWVDSVYIDARMSSENVSSLITACAQMAVPVHFHISSEGRKGQKIFSEKLGGTIVLTSAINYATPLQAFFKRALDIVGGLFGSLIALLIIIVVGPIIKKKSPGPILFAQERIGLNGKHFKMYKIRSMVMNADALKKELLEKNRVKDGMMFKLDFDPRIIGNEILPDGTHKTGIGEFIRKTSIDEFPQFFNVLKGDMSLVGTRPPTIDEWEKYEYHHRARLAVRPGITGMWQVSGRSEITDFEEVVKLDTEYITSWTPELDIKILFKTIAVLFTRKGAM